LFCNQWTTKIPSAAGPPIFSVFVNATNFSANLLIIDSSTIIRLANIQI